MHAVSEREPRSAVRFQSPPRAAAICHMENLQPSILPSRYDHPPSTLKTHPPPSQCPLKVSNTAGAPLRTALCVHSWREEERQAGEVGRADVRGSKQGRKRVGLQGLSKQGQMCVASSGSVCMRTLRYEETCAT